MELYGEKSFDYSPNRGERIGPKRVGSITTFPARGFRANEEGLAMWTTLFAVTAIIAVGLSFAAIAVDSAHGGKFRL